MREIKFRAWDKEKKRMIPSVGFSDNDTGRTWKRELYMVDDGTDSFSMDWIPMQFTGLKDKNDLQDIYEGDIIDIWGNIKGNIYENKEVYKERTDCIVKELCTKDWRDTEEELIKRGCRYAQ